MTDQELQQAFLSIPREAFEAKINEQDLRLIAEPVGNGSNEYLYSVESSILVPIKERRKPLFLTEYIPEVWA